MTNETRSSFSISSSPFLLPPSRDKSAASRAEGATGQREAVNGDGGWPEPAPIGGRGSCGRLGRGPANVDKS